MSSSLDPLTDEPAGGSPEASRVARRKGGAPVRVEGLTRILDMASRDFAKHGFTGASIEAIARDAGVGKVTIYRHYDNKLGLFRAVFARSWRLARKRMQQIIDAGGPPETVLMSIGKWYSQRHSDEENVGLLHVFMGQVQSHPELAFSEQSHSDFRQPLVDYFNSLVAEGIFMMDDVALGATQFLHLSVLATPRPMVVNMDSWTREDERERVVIANVRLFLNGVLRDRDRTAPPEQD